MFKIYYNLSNVEQLSSRPCAILVGDKPSDADMGEEYPSLKAGGDPSFLKIGFLNDVDETGELFHQYQSSFNILFRSGSSFTRVTELVQSLKRRGVRYFDAFDQKFDHGMQLTPTIPQEARHREESFVFQKDRHGNVWIRVLCHGCKESDGYMEVDTNLLQKLIYDAEVLTSGAVYVGIPQSLLDSPGCVRLLSKHEFKVHYVYEKTGELIYVNWVCAGHSKVPMYATSIEGAGCLILSPDEQKVLLVYEKDRWGRCGGAVDLAESSLQAALREVFEEVDIEIDTDKQILMGATFCHRCARDGIINNHFNLYIVKAAVKKDEVQCKEEVTKAKWFSVEKLVREWENYQDTVDWKEYQQIPDFTLLGSHCASSKFLKEEAVKIPQVVSLAYDDDDAHNVAKFQCLELFALSKLRQKRCQPIGLWHVGSKFPAEVF